MANPKGNPQNLLPGGVPGNKGGGRWSSSAKEARALWLETIKAMPTDHPDHKTLAEARDAKIAQEVVHGNGYMAQWLVEMEMGKPSSRFEVEIGDTEVFLALGRILPGHCDKATCEAILIDLHAQLKPDA